MRVSMIVFFDKFRITVDYALEYEFLKRSQEGELLQSFFPKLKKYENCNYGHFLLLNEELPLFLEFEKATCL